jgi:hypothetical protein
MINSFGRRGEHVLARSGNTRGPGRTHVGLTLAVLMVASFAAAGCLSGADGWAVVLAGNRPIEAQKELLLGFNITAVAVDLRINVTNAGPANLDVRVYAVEDPSHPETTASSGWNLGRATAIEGDVRVNRGPYALGISCLSMDACPVQYRLEARALSVVPHGEAGCVSATVGGKDPSVLPGWKGPALPTGNVLAVISPETDYLGQGINATYTPKTGEFFVQPKGGHVRVVAGGWDIELTMPEACTKLVQGYFPSLLRDSFRARPMGGLAVSFASRDCGASAGQAVIDDVAYDNVGALTRLAFRFEHRCGGPSGVPLLGVVHYDAGAPRPACDGRPASTGFKGNRLKDGSPALDQPASYLHIVRDNGPAVTFAEGDGLRVTAAGNRVSMQTATDDWSITLRLPYYCDDVRPGSYGALATSVEVVGDPGACLAAANDVVIDAVTRDDSGNLRRLDARFESGCAAAGGPMAAALHWEPAQVS